MPHSVWSFVNSSCRKRTHFLSAHSFPQSGRIWGHWVMRPDRKDTHTQTHHNTTHKQIQHTNHTSNTHTHTPHTHAHRHAHTHTSIYTCTHIYIYTHMCTQTGSHIHTYTRHGSGGPLTLTPCSCSLFQLVPSPQDVPKGKAALSFLRDARMAS